MGALQNIMDIVYIRDLRIEAVIGIFEWEKRIRQTIRIDLEMGWDNRRAAETDAIEDALDYKKAAQRVRQFAQENSFELVETLAEKIASLLLTELKLPWVKLTLGKPNAVKKSSEVGVIIERRAS